MRAERVEQRQRAAGAEQRAQPGVLLVDDA
jgi:hypothetical protein